MDDALRMISTGDAITAAQAALMGLIDAVTDDELLPAALTFARQLLEAQRGARPTRELSITHTDLSILDKAAADLQRKRPVLPAPLKVIEALRAAATLDFDAGMAVERAAFLELRASAESRGYRHAFFAEREAARVPESLATAVAHRVCTVAVVGAGTMGQGIALCCAEAGYTVQLSDANDSVLTRAFDGIKRSCDSRVKRARLSQDAANQIMARIQPARSTAEMAHADLVVEAVFEELEVKRQVLTALDAQVKPGAIIASNTSYLDIDQIAVATTRPQQVIGLHFFSPAHAMQLVEVVPGARTDADVIATALQFGRRLGKHAVLVGNCRGFVGNRMLARRVRESYFLLEEGATPAQVDQAFTEFGFPMGPFAVGDLSGLDIGWRNRQATLAKLTAREQRCTILDQMVASGRLGQKTGSGFYQYDEQRRATPDAEVVALIEQHSRDVGISRRVISSDEIIERCLLAMVDEAARILDEGIARCASDIDVVWLHGYGFPRHRGGPMHYADQLGLGAVRAAMLRYQTQQGSEYWSVAPLLEQLVQSGGTFAEWTPKVAEAQA
jgi:3-hydroxyacyl-CoA dehydrogenase